MSKLIDVLSDCLASAQLDSRLSRNDRHMLEGFTAVLDAYRDGTDVFTYIARVEAAVAAEDAATAKRQAGRAKARRPASISSKRRAAAPVQSSRRRAA